MRTVALLYSGAFFICAGAQFRELMLADDLKNQMKLRICKVQIPRSSLLPSLWALLERGNVEKPYAYSERYG